IQESAKNQVFIVLIIGPKVVGVAFTPVIKGYAEKVYERSGRVAFDIDIDPRCANGKTRRAKYIYCLVAYRHRLQGKIARMPLLFCSLSRFSGSKCTGQLSDCKESFPVVSLYLLFPYSS